MMSVQDQTPGEGAFNDDEVFEDRPAPADDSTNDNIMGEVNYDEKQFEFDLGEVTLIKSKLQVFLQLREFRIKNQHNSDDRSEELSGTSPPKLPSLFYSHCPNFYIHTNHLCSANVPTSILVK